MPKFALGQDDSIYYVTAKALAQGHGYRIESLPDEPWQTKYPPLLPLFLSAVWRIAPGFPANLALATLFSWVWLPLWVALAYRVFRDLGLDSRVAIALCGALALNGQAVEFSMKTQPDLMVAVLWTASAALVARARQPAWMTAGAGVLAGAAYLAKTAALPMIVAAPLYYVARRQFRKAVLFAAAMLPAVLGWNLWVRARMVPGGDPLRAYYTDYLGYHWHTVHMAGYLKVLAKNADALVGATGALLLDWVEGPGLLERAMGVVILAGMVWHFRRTGINPYHVFAGLYVGMLLIWHYPPNMRFLLPVLPLLLAGLWAEIAIAYGALRARPWAAKALASAAAAVLVYFGIGGWRELHASFPKSRAVRTAASRPAYEWIARHTAAGQTFLAGDDVELYLFTGRKAIRPTVPMGYFYRDDVAGVADFVTSRPAIARRLGLDYILDCPWDWSRELLPGALELRALSRQRLARSPQAQRVWAAGESAIYRVLPREAHVRVGGIN